jgi:hypothetical protein
MAQLNRARATRRSRIRGALWAVTAVLAASSAGAQSAMTTEYDVRYGPLTVLSLRAATDSADGGYRTTTEAHTVGVVAMMFPWHASATTEGRLDAGGFRPLAHRSNGKYRGQRRSVVIEYGVGGAVVAAVDPPADDDYRDAVPIALQQETVDPLTATLSALASQCRGTVRVFDGRRRYDMELTDLGVADVPQLRGAAYTGSARHCRTEMRPIAGFWRTGPQHDERPSRLDSWIASPRPGLPPVPVYLELSSQRGTLAIVLTRATAAPMR